MSRPSIDVSTDQLADRHAIDQRLVDRAIDRAAIDAQSARGIALWVKIDDERRCSREGQICCEVDYGGRLTDAAFLVAYRL